MALQGMTAHDFESLRFTLNTLRESVHKIKQGGLQVTGRKLGTLLCSQMFVCQFVRVREGEKLCVCEEGGERERERE